MTVVFWVVTPHSFVGGYQCFRGTSVSTHKTAEFHNSDIHDLNVHCCENLKSDMNLLLQKINTDVYKIGYYVYPRNSF
jgi:hypothetical protein